jgi:heterodisulfide reductase subunit A-like polyferredoxin
MTDADSQQGGRPGEARAAAEHLFDVARAMERLTVVGTTRQRAEACAPERDVTDEPPRIGVFVCHCGQSIASVVDVEQVAARARRLPHVVFAGHYGRLCDDAGQDLITLQIAERRLNRVVVASCTPRTHEPLFRDVLRAAGLNPHLLELVNVRAQCAWVHAGVPAQATAKSNDLVRMAVGRAAHLTALRDRKVPVHRAALVVGATSSGLTAALAIADRGLPVHLVEIGDRLGESIDPGRDTPLGPTAHAYLEEAVQRVRRSPRITVHLHSEVISVDGQMGSFKSRLCSDGKDTEIEHGVIVVDTAAVEHTAIPLHTDGFCPRALTKLGPTELGSEGLFTCGATDGPDSIPEMISKVGAISERAAAILARKEISVGVQAAYVDSSRCVCCMTCMHVCLQSAPRVGKDSKSEIQEAACVGCGTCCAECPSQAITLPRHTDAQVRAALGALLQPHPRRSDKEETCAAPLGIAVPRWRRERKRT